VGIPFYSENILELLPCLQDLAASTSSVQMPRGDVRRLEAGFLFFYVESVYRTCCNRVAGYSWTRRSYPDLPECVKSDYTGMTVLIDKIDVIVGRYMSSGETPTRHIITTYSLFELFQYDCINDYSTSCIMYACTASTCEGYRSPYLADADSFASMTVY
jgi:hypothetical protein